MSLKNKITEDMKTAMRAKDTARLSARCACCSPRMKQKEVDERVELTDADVLVDHREDDQAAPRVDRPVREGGRQDLADAEKFEIGVLSAYLPQQLSEAEVAEAVAAAIAEAGAAGAKDMGKVMALAEAAARRHAPTWARFRGW